MGVLDKFTKKATDNAVETAKETLNEKLETYSGIIKIGLTLAVVLFGTKKLGQHITRAESGQYPQQPIIINNYYDRRYIPNGKQRQNSQRHQERR